MLNKYRQNPLKASSIPLLAKIVAVWLCIMLKFAPENRYFPSRRRTTPQKGSAGKSTRQA